MKIRLLLTAIFVAVLTTGCAEYPYPINGTVLIGSPGRYERDDHERRQERHGHDRENGQHGHED